MRPHAMHQQEDDDFSEHTHRPQDKKPQNDLHKERVDVKEHQNLGDNGDDDQYVEMGQQPKLTNSSRATDPVVQWRRSDSVIDANEMLEQQRVIYGDDNMDQYRTRV